MSTYSISFRKTKSLNALTSSRRYASNSSTSSSLSSSTFSSSSESSEAIEATATIFHTLRYLITVIVIVLAIDIVPGPDVANAEYFSSIDSLQQLNGVELGLLKAFREYLDFQDKDLESHQRFIENVKLQHTMAMEDVDDYLGNPINAFTLIKRMVTDWNNLHEFIKEGQAVKAFRENLENILQNNQLPDDNELKGAVNGLARLQRIYKLQTTDVANGKINGKQYGTKLSWHDCFVVATSLYDLKQFEAALSWFEMTLRKLDTNFDSDKDSTEHKFLIETLEYLGLTHYELGNSERAIEYLNELLDLVPDHQAKDMRIYVMNSPAKKPPPPLMETQHLWYQNYSRLCQGIQEPDKKLHGLQCKLENRGNPELILAPLKIEQLSCDPQVTLYHGLLTDRQIQGIFDASANLTRIRSTVKSGATGIVSDVRNSQQVWLDYTTDIMKTLARIVERTTGLSMKNVEHMQMANYGIGGQYNPHHDYLLGSDTGGWWIGDRLATNMFYLSDVEQGGFTVFPLLNIFSKPIKGSMVSWYNLHKSLAADRRTLHAGCPVLRGSKRIGNVWVHSGYHEFIRPCDLKDDIENSLGYVV